MRTMQSWMVASIVMAAPMSSFGLPNITQQPTDQSVSIGATASHMVVASGVAPLTYQWWFEGDDLEDATNATLALPNVQLSHAGRYWVVVSDASGSITSRVAVLNVDPTFTKVTTGSIVTTPGHSASAAWGDYDNDGDIDLFVTQFYQTNANNVLYRNEGNGEFTRITSLPVTGGSGWAGGIWGDYDNDGHLDLFASPSIFTTQPRSLLYHNKGDGTFALVTSGDIFATTAYTLGSAWGDYDNDGFIDLFVPTFSTGGNDFLFRNSGDGSFARVVSGVIVQDAAQTSGPAWADMDNDGDLDLAVPAGTTCLLYTNLGNGSFRRITSGTIPSAGGDPIACAWGDYNNDGNLDLFVANSETLKNFLFRNDGGGNFTRITNGPIVNDIAVSRSPAWGDYDNDGWLDLFVANGGSYIQTNHLYRNNGDGTFTRVVTGSPATDKGIALGAAWGDYDNDGFLDLFVANGDNGPRMDLLYHNNGNSNNWINFKLVGTRSNRAAIGVKVRVKATIGGRTLWQLREISGGHGLGSQNDLRANFGLGDAALVETIRVEWPSGVLQELVNLAPKQFLNLTEIYVAIQPSQTNVALGSNVTFTAMGPAGLNLSWQWQLNGSNLVEATNATLTLTQVQTGQSGSYRVVASDGVSWTFSRPATLQVFDQPVITVQPEDRFARPGTNVTFAVSAYSPTALTYQWQFNGNNLLGATNATLTLSNVNLSNGGVYLVTVNDASGSTLSAPAWLTLLIDPLIVQQPCSVSVPQGGSVTLSVAVTNTATPPIGFRWRRGSLTVAHAVGSEYVNFLTLTNCQLTTNYEVLVTNLARVSILRSSNVVVTVLPDADADGLPDQWEIDCGISQSSPSHALADDDGDGLSNLQEHMAGTHPTNALSYLKVESIALANGGRAAVLRFLAVSNQTYTVQFRWTVDRGEWNRLADVVAATTNRTVEVLDPEFSAEEPQRIYRLATPRVP